MPERLMGTDCKFVGKANMSTLVQIRLGPIIHWSDMKWYNPLVLSKCLIWKKKSKFRIYLYLLFIWFSLFFPTNSHLSNDLDSYFFIWKIDYQSILIWNEIRKKWLVIRVVSAKVYIYVDMNIPHPASVIRRRFRSKIKIERVWMKSKEYVCCTLSFPGIVVQLVRAPPCQGGSYGFEPRQSRRIKIQ